MRLLLNTIWFVLAGLWMAIAYAIAALICFIFIVTIRFGVVWLRIGILALWPFGKPVVKRADAGIASGMGNVNGRRLGFVEYDLAVSTEGRIVTLEEGWRFVGARRPPLGPSSRKAGSPARRAATPARKHRRIRQLRDGPRFVLGRYPCPTAGGRSPQLVAAYRRGERLCPACDAVRAGRRCRSIGRCGRPPSATRSTTALTPPGGLVLGVPYLTNAAVSEFSDMFSTLARLALSFVPTRAARQANQVPHGGMP